MQSNKTMITKDISYEILKQFAKEYKKENGFMPIEIIIVGGGSILLNYGFRDFTQDFDVMVLNDIKNVVNRVADYYNLSNDWMNTDFIRTKSYSSKLREVSSHYCSFNKGSVEFRTVKGEYLIAMKMVSAREYRNDLSDIAGIILFLKKNNNEINYEKIDNAIKFLYDNYDIKESVILKVKEFLNLSIPELEKEYKSLAIEENEIGEELLIIDKKYRNAVEEETVDVIAQQIKSKKNKKYSR